MMSPERVSNPAALIGEVDVQVHRWDGSSTFNISGIDGLTRQDLDKLQLYSAMFIKDGNIKNLTTPVGKIKEVLVKYGICG